MKAKEMFKELGYECNEYYENIEDELYAIYVYEKKNKYIICKEIAFFPNLKQVGMYGNNDIERSCLWNSEELKAINKQVEELGWLGSDKE